MNGGDYKIDGSYPLNTFKLHRRAIPTRVFIVIYTCALIALLYHHFFNLHRSIYFSLPLVVADLVLAFMCVSSHAFRWRPITRKVYPENLSRVINDEELPGLDVFVFTADPYKEPPMVTLNTVLSVLALDYPSDKLSVYVSDDGGSQLSLFAMMEGAKFAKHWLPFVKGHHINLRCPNAFFSSSSGGHELSTNSEYVCEKIKMKELYDQMKVRVEQVMDKGYIEDIMIESDEEREAFSKWNSRFSRQDHPTIIQVILESAKDSDVAGKCLPNLIYVSREKQNNVCHNFKAGSQNALIRVSAAMTNAPMILSLDCDVYCNDPQAPRKALCLLIDPNEGPRTAYVQFPQRYKGTNANDIYSNEYNREFIIDSEGQDGIGFTNYTGSGQFINRKSFYGGAPSGESINKETSARESINSKPILTEAFNAAACNYEQGTSWGSTMGFKYGSLVENFYPGYRGWCSVFYNPSTPAFLGGSPITLNESLIHVKRIAVGLLECLWSKHCHPLSYATENWNYLLLSLGYTFNHCWCLVGMPIVIYGLLPQLALLNNVYLFPKVSDPWFYMYAFLFVTSYIRDFVENLLYGFAFRKWWNEQRMWLIRGVTAYSFALLECALRPLGIFSLDFSLTSKVVDKEQQMRYDQEIFDFGTESPFLVSLSTFALVNLVSFSFGIMKLMMGNGGKLDEMFVQLFLSGFVVVNAWPIYEAMLLRRDGGRMPTRVTLISILLTWTLCYFSVL